VIVAACYAIAACGFDAHGPESAPRAKITGAQSTHEARSPRSPKQSTTGGSLSAATAIHRFAEAYINWTAGTVAADMRSLASTSVGQARSAVELAAAQTSSDYELQQAGVSNSGNVEAIAPLAAGADEYVVVTRESTRATNTTAYQGLRPAWHVTIATVEQVRPGVWVVSGWQPEV
jgi:hypothetical protein